MDQYRELVLGGPGCGKTTRLLSLVESHLKNGIQPDEIAFVAFTRRAATEAKERATALFGYQDDDLPYFRTLHSFAFKELTISHEQLMSSIHYSELGNVLKIKFGDVEDEFGLMSDQYERGSQYYYIEQQARLRCVDLKAMCLLDGRQGIQYLEHYRTSLNIYKQHRNLFDYTDILQVWCDQMKPLPIKVLIVDEAQDLSLLQWQVIHKMAKGVPYVYYAGDDDQAIYHWAGADIKHFLTLDAKRTVLPISYRLPRTIFARCNRISQKIRERYKKEWSSADREGSVNLVHQPEMAPLDKGEWLILARSHYQLENIAYHLKVKGFAFIHRGHSSLNSPDALAVKAWLRAKESEYISAGDVKRILAKTPKGSLKLEDKNIFQLEDSNILPREILFDQYGIDLSRSWQEALSLRPVEKIYLNLVLKKEGTLDSTPRIKVATIHSVKGGECDNVLLMPDMSSASYESYLKQPDSEARVFYVGASRAKERLVICHPQTSNYFPV